MIDALTQQLEDARLAKDWDKVTILDKGLKQKIGKQVETCKTPEEAKAMMDDLQKLMYAYQLTIEACQQNNDTIKRENQGLHKGLKASKQYLSWG